jgi:hypothetical protein
MTSGSGLLAGWASEAVIVLVEPGGQQSRADNRTAGEGRAAASSMRDDVRRGSVSAVTASSAAVGSVLVDPVRALQHALYRAAKADPGRRFHALGDKVFRRDVLWRAWVAVYRNDGAPGLGKAPWRMSRSTVLPDSWTRWPPSCAMAVIDRCRRVGCASRSQGRRSGDRCRFPSVRDRMVQAALKIVLEPVFEAGFLSCSLGFRPKRSPHDGLQVVIDEAWRGRRWVVETDIAECFSEIPHDKLMRGGRGAGVRSGRVEARARDTSCGSDGRTVGFAGR